jgi:hypothetical protein
MIFRRADRHQWQAVLCRPPHRLSREIDVEVEPWTHTASHRHTETAAMICSIAIWRGICRDETQTLPPVWQAVSPMK